jgi:hypothetical protein
MAVDCAGRRCNRQRDAAFRPASLAARIRATFAVSSQSQNLMRMPVARAEFVQLPGGGARITLSTGQARSGGIALVIGLVGLATVGVFYAVAETHACFILGCGGFAALVALLGIWALFTAAVVGSRLADATLTLAQYPLRLGEHFEVAYEQAVRRTHQIALVSIALKCEEVARYRVGTDTKTAKRTVLEERRTLLESGTAAPDASLASSVTFEIPPTAMHSFDQPNNKVLWTLRLRIEIPKLPDYVAECGLTVSPKLATAGVALPPIAGSEQDAEASDSTAYEGGE